MKGYTFVEKLILGYSVVVGTVAVIGLIFGLTKECLK